MKRFLMVTLVIFLLATMLFNITVFAANNRYDLDELELEVTIPTEYTVITKDTPANDPIFSDLGTTKSALMSQFESGNIYLNAVSYSYNEEIVVTMTENQLSSFSVLSDTELSTLTSTLINQYSDYGINVSEYDVYQHSQAKFIKIYFTDSNNTVHGLQYYTIYDGKAINFTMRSYEGNLSLRQQSNIKEVVDSVIFDNAPPVVETGEDTDSFVHTDTDSGVSFTVPANWKQKAFSEDRETLDVKFASTKEDGCLIMFGSNDLWEQLPDSDKNGYSREDINISAFTKSDIAEMYGITADEISVVTYNDIQYYKCETTSTSDSYGVDITVTMTQLVHISNGWVYMFQFSGTSEDKMYSDFETLLNSVQYPNSFGISSSSNDTPSDTSVVLISLIFLVIIAIIVVAIILIQKKKKENEMLKTVENYYSDLTENSNKFKPTTICKNCGQTLPSDSAFCHVCGTKIDKERD